ncbi:PREDICTED: dyslexia susceptibility 1 candidate gene 1 protein homolog [Atta cephalotes]|uniref:CS domain-containing protein n=1 Tax=Atta cephalotes TaxID=12957 RepID=A0A158NM76_ATTCE|nr:PREDICTED: dyslexia susceptibility 1 candidate gene 1 protein homolog [Atta cephalotes]
MAIIIKDYQWRQTDKRIIIYVPLKSRPKNVHLFVMDNYVKISFSPFILELFLWENVLEEESECTLTDTEAIFSLQKTNLTVNWPILEVENISKSEKYHARNQVLEKAQKVLENRAKCKKEKLQNLQKEAIKIQINLDTDTLNKIEALRDSHRKAAMQDFEDWRLNAEIPFLQNISGKVQKNRKTYRPPLQWFKDDLGIIQTRETDKKELEGNQQDKSIIIEELEEELIVEEKPEEGLTVEENINKDLIVNESIEQTNSKDDITLNENIGKKADVEIKETTNMSKNFNFAEYSSYSEDSESNEEITSSKSSTNSLVKKMDQKFLQKFCTKTKKQRSDRDLIDRILESRYPKINQIFDEPTKAIPLPRRSGTINVTFSERAFPTPARESSFIEEQEWLSKQAEARRKTGFVAEDLRPEEQDPQWLKDKGDDFFKARNYLAAISAYTHGIKISDKMAALYVNRSAAHYALGNYYRCIDDCSKVLELMEPKCESNRASRARCHARRGAALCKLSAPQHGIPELETALKLDPNNKSIQHDLYAVKQYFNIRE